MSLGISQWLQIKDRLLVLLNLTHLRQYLFTEDLEGKQSQANYDDLENNTFYRNHQLLTTNPFQS